MGSLLPKLGELLKEEYKLQKGVKKDVASLSNEMRSMHAALHKVAGVPLEQLDEQVRLWASDVRDLSYHMEDVVDRFLVRVEGFEVAPDSDGLKLLVNKMATLFTKGKTRRRIADAIKDIKEQMQDVTARRDRYRVDGLVVNVAATRTLDPRLSALYNKVTDLVGIDEPRDELIKRLTDEKTPTEVVSIAGFGGLGKTTLAKTVYDSLKSQFHCAAFVSLSQNPVITRILKKMLHQLDQQKYAHINEASWDETQLIDELRMFLSNKRFDVLRVLDLSGCHVGESNQNTLRDVGNLVHLRYLGLAGADICELPTEIGKLRFLQVLDVRNNPDLEELPWTIYGLRRLICLHVDGYRTRLPAGGLGNLTSLEVLRRVPASLTIMKELRNLESLRELKIKFEHNVSSELEEAFVKCLSKLQKIQSVVIRGCFPSIDLLGEGWVPPRHLRTFDLFMLGKFSKIPAWIEREPSILWNLSELIIGLKEVQPEDLRVLGSLPALRILALHSAQQAQRLLAIGANAGFHCLVAFSLYCESPRQIMFQQGALPMAEAVLFNFGVQKAIEDGNGGYFFGLGNLPSIRRLYVGIDRHGATVAEVKEAVTKLQRAVGAHPNHPSIAADIRPPIQPVDEDEVKTSNEVTPSKGQDEEKTWEPKKFQERFQNFRAKTTSDSNSEI
ncbi:hypothetical protein ZWY2020_027106 [Hordeum vulgare]|nr:hypothetical protein ZWY2020_027106 [Hordeum vulgare]